MQIKTTSGSGAGALGIIGTGLALALPDAKWIGWTLVLIGFFVFVFDIHLERGQLASIKSAATLKQRFKRMWPQYLMLVCGIGFFVGLVAFLQLNINPSRSSGSGGVVKETETLTPTPPERVSVETSRIVVSGFAFVPTNASNLDLGYEIRLHVVNRGKIHGYAPLVNFAFKSTNAPFSEREIDEEMRQVKALSRLPPDDSTREAVEVGVDAYMTLPSGISREAYADVTSGKTIFYLFVALNYRDDSLPPGKYWISEYCAFQTKEIMPNNFQLCRGHNGVSLNQN